jgi:hypothetical protein
MDVPIWFPCSVVPSITNRIAGPLSQSTPRYSRGTMDCINCIIDLRTSSLRLYIRNFGCIMLGSAHYSPSTSVGEPLWAGARAEEVLHHGCASYCNPHSLPYCVQLKMSHCLIGCIAECGRSIYSRTGYYKMLPTMIIRDSLFSSTLGR